MQSERDVTANIHPKSSTNSVVTSKTLKVAPAAGALSIPPVVSARKEPSLTSSLVGSAANTLVPMNQFSPKAMDNNHRFLDNLTPSTLVSFDQVEDRTDKLFQDQESSAILPIRNSTLKKGSLHVIINFSSLLYQLLGIFHESRSISLLFNRRRTHN